MSYREVHSLPIWEHHRLSVVAWWMVVFSVLTVYLVALPIRYTQIVEAPLDVRESRAVLGLSDDFVAIYYCAFEVAVTALFVVSAIGLYRYRPDYRPALLMSMTMVLAGVAFPPTIGALKAWPIARGLVAVIEAAGFGVGFLVFYVFPDGRFVPPFTKYLAVAFGVWLMMGVLYPTTLWHPQNWSVAAHLAVVLVWFGSLVIAQAYRYTRVSNAIEKLQTKWVFFGLSIGLLNFGLLAPFALFSPLQEPTTYQQLYVLAIYPFYYLLFPALIPVTIAFSVFRYRLWDIDVVINRTLVYGVLTTLIFAGYVLVVGAFTAVFHSQGSVLGSLLGAGVVAAIVQPIRQRLQRAVNRLLYGQRDDPYTVLSGLGERLQSALPTSEVFSTITYTIAQSLRLPYVAVARKTEADYWIAAEHIDERYRLPEGGYDRAFLKRGGALLAFSLTHQTETLGELRLALRAPGDELSPAEQRLLRDIALHAGLALHNHQLSEEAQRARERLVAAREDERRRIRRDLHDHFAPALAGLTLKIDAIRNRLIREPQAAQEMLAELRDRTQHTINEIRQLAYDLRPPALDDLGLVGALRDLAARLNDRHGLAVGVGFHGEGPPLTAAVEAAAYRIAAEALLNVVRHAQATHCTVHLSYQPGPALLLEVHDDGQGAATPFRAGVGLSGMRERAEELGGALAISTTLGGGTYLRAELPIRPAHTEAKDNLEWVNFES